MSSPMITIWIVAFVTSEGFVNNYNLKQNRSTERLGILIGMLQVGTKSVSNSLRIRHNTTCNVVHKTCIWSLVVTAQLESMIKICQYMVTIV